eukprot:m.396476 g.396476  ORF g.396476 m.396476 type:complete len:127 (-) comp56411_c0_seq1:144-524(-)
MRLRLHPPLRLDRTPILPFPLTTCSTCSTLSVLMRDRCGHHALNSSRNKQVHPLASGCTMRQLAESLLASGTAKADQKLRNGDVITCNSAPMTVSHPIDEDNEWVYDLYYAPQSAASIERMALADG